MKLNPLALEVGSVVMVFEVVVRAREAGEEVVATRSHEGHMVRVVAGNCM